MSQTPSYITGTIGEAVSNGKEFKSTKSANTEELSQDRNSPAISTAVVSTPENKAVAAREANAEVYADVSDSNAWKVKLHAERHKLLKNSFKKYKNFKTGLYRTLASLVALAVKEFVHESISASELLGLILFEAGLIRGSLTIRSEMKFEESDKFYKPISLKLTESPIPFSALTISSFLPNAAIRHAVVLKNLTDVFGDFTNKIDTTFETHQLDTSWFHDELTPIKFTQIPDATQTTTSEKINLRQSDDTSVAPPNLYNDELEIVKTHLKQLAVEYAEQENKVVEKLLASVPGLQNLTVQAEAFPGLNVKSFVHPAEIIFVDETDSIQMID